MASGGSVGREAAYQLKRERDRLGRFVQMIKTRPYKILLEEAARMKAEMLQQVPYDSGDLFNSIKCEVSGKKTQPVLTASASSIHNGYDYAEIQHDTPWFEHRVGKWHYISDPFEHGVERIERRFEEEIKLE